jgi:hypothetical protein
MAISKLSKKDKTAILEAIKSLSSRMNLAWRNFF